MEGAPAKILGRATLNTNKMFTTYTKCASYLKLVSPIKTGRFLYRTTQAWQVEKKVIEVKREANKESLDRMEDKLQR